jgi:V8-like Glu-specific endopeptidase
MASGGLTTAARHGVDAHDRLRGPTFQKEMSMVATKRPQGVRDELRPGVIEGQPGTEAQVDDGDSALEEADGSALRGTDLHQSVSSPRREAAIVDYEGEAELDFERRSQGTIDSDEEGFDETTALPAFYAAYSSAASRSLLMAARSEARATPEVVIGTDDRVRVMATTTYPWRSICSLLITAADGTRWIGTGWLAGPRLVVTAGHCVYIHDHGGFARSVTVIPGRNAAAEPYGRSTQSDLRTVVGWASLRNSEYDYGAILLRNGSAFGARVGSFGFAAYADSDLRGKLANLSGYPGDKPTGTQWYHALGIKGVSARRLVYDIDTAGGQSGAPVWRRTGSSRIAVGIHTNGASSGNSATRIVVPVRNNIVAWRTAAGN